eukprot:CAMPEP_0197698852 /NCGR_PEP_ID=MMETSP1338-20131121/119838_1 /TAXON_ID=43686 ORGANISM="Pelagodinium beii, Strain RCC1491" /NCGR_SAMPLE_ID=MMETSP1338 /ASSEMBLY_ACC=CAM_ASM_000754 /LENGTH=73 /DNA_ID=CAMNT_0043282281 /DNA_START=84 /DNA_END=302 /DNA_ORIENTATION=-
MEGLADTLGDFAQNVKEQAKAAIEEKAGEEVVPDYLKPLNPILGPIGVLENCMCLVPEDKQADAKGVIEAYKS